MFTSLWIAKTGLDAQQTRMDVVSNNLANTNTTGFKRARAEFEDLTYQNRGQAGAQTTEQTQSPTGFMIGTGVRVVGTQKMFEQGGSQQTDNPYDVRINGRGFLQVTLPDGTVGYSRDGSLKRNSDGQMVTNDGYPIEPAITVPVNATSLTIGKDGTVSVTTPGNAAAQQIGQIQLADFTNPAGLEPRGDNLYVETASSGAPQTGTAGLNGLGTLEQNSLETSNVNVVEEMVNMIETQRAYEMNSKAISASDQMLQFITQQT
ncbi:flagellar basal-body rod protein FlgG [Luteibacter sp. PPL554]